MAIADDWTIDTEAKTITHTAGATVYSVTDLYKYITKEFAKFEYMDDRMPFKMSTDANGGILLKYVSEWGFGDNANDYKFLKSGSVESYDGDNYWQNVVTTGDLFDASDVVIIQDGTPLAGWWLAGNIDVLVWVKVDGVWIDDGDVYVKDDTVVATYQYPLDYRYLRIQGKTVPGSQILVAESDGVGSLDINKSQYTIDSAGDEFITVTDYINVNTAPITGSLRVGDTKYEYTSYKDKTFTVIGDATGETGSLYVPFIDTLAVGSVVDSGYYVSSDDINIVVVVRKYGYLEYISGIAVGLAGLILDPTLSNDPIIITRE